jgi:hypothetical protein
LSIDALIAELNEQQPKSCVRNKVESGCTSGRLRHADTAVLRYDDRSPDAAAVAQISSPAAIEVICGPTA